MQKLWLSVQKFSWRKPSRDLLSRRFGDASGRTKAALPLNPSPGLPRARHRGAKGFDPGTMVSFTPLPSSTDASKGMLSFGDSFGTVRNR